MTRNRFFLALLAIASLAFVAPVASAQTLSTVSAIGSSDVVPDVPNAFPSATSQFASMLQLRSFTLGQNSQHLTAPTLTTSSTVCGGSTAVLTSGTDLSGQVAEGSSASTSCVITFAKAFATAPECFVSLDNVADSALKCHTTTTTATITQTSASSNVLNYLIVGLAGG